MQLVQVSFDKILQTRAYTVMILGTPDKQFAIYTEPAVGKMLQMVLTDTPRVRPLTFDFLYQLFQGMEVRVKQVVIKDVQDTVYYSRLFLEQQLNGVRQIIEIDARPSDSLTLALMSGAPVYCTKEVLEKTISVKE